MAFPSKIRRLIRNLASDLRYGKFLGGTIPTRYAGVGAHDSANTDYKLLEWLFHDIAISSGDVLVDLGSGKGRVINWWLAQGYSNRIIGVEIDPAVANPARRRLRRFHNVEVITGNVLEHLPEEGNVFYMYNPFSREVVAQVVRELERLRRPITVVYYNPTAVDLFDSAKGWKRRDLRPPDLADRPALPASILSLGPRAQQGAESQDKQKQPLW
jgi:SAM-dependent methyltransferase